MSKSKNKTVETKASVTHFLKNIENPQRKKDSAQVHKMMREITGERAKMWGPSIVGYGRYHYRYESGREGDFMKVGFSPRKANMTIYIMPGFKKYESLMAKLGKHKTGKSCLYINKLDEVDLKILAELIKESYSYMTQKYG